MKCDKMRSEFMEAVLSGPQAVSPEMQQHLKTCEGCSQELVSLQQTMALLDEWKAPEPSPYFSSRLRVRVRELGAAQPAGWFAWFRRPAVANAAAGLIALGAGLLSASPWRSTKVTMAGNDGVVHVATPSPAVSDLQYLDRNADLFAEFDALDGQSQTE